MAAALAQARQPEIAAPAAFDGFFRNDGTGPEMGPSLPWGESGWRLERPRPGSAESDRPTPPMRPRGPPLRRVALVTAALTPLIPILYGAAPPLWLLVTLPPAVMLALAAITTDWLAGLMKARPLRSMTAAVVLGAVTAILPIRRISWNAQASSSPVSNPRSAARLRRRRGAVLRNAEGRRLLSALSFGGVVRLPRFFIGKLDTHQNFLAPLNGVIIDIDRLPNVFNADFFSDRAAGDDQMPTT